MKFVNIGLTFVYAFFTYIYAKVKPIDWLQYFLELRKTPVKLMKALFCFQTAIVKIKFVRIRFSERLASK